MSELHKGFITSTGGQSSVSCTNHGGCEVYRYQGPHSHRQSNDTDDRTVEKKNKVWYSQYYSLPAFIFYIRIIEGRAARPRNQKQEIIMNFHRFKCQTNLVVRSLIMARFGSNWVDLIEIETGRCALLDSGLPM